MIRTALFFLFILLTCAKAFAAPPVLHAPWTIGESWSCSTYDGHPGGGGAPDTRNCVDFNTAGDFGKAIKAAHDGFVSQQTSTGYGNYVVLTYKDDTSYRTYYAHLNGFEGADGREVKTGDTIGYCGTTGTSTASHLHFELRQNNQNVNIDTLEFCGQRLNINYTPNQSGDYYGVFILSKDHSTEGSGNAGDIYVDAVSGSDTNNGSQGSPVKTITKALTLISTNGTIRLKGNQDHSKPLPKRITQRVKFLTYGGVVARIR